MRPLLPITLVMIGIVGVSMGYSPNLSSGQILLEIPATSGATIGEVTFGNPESGITEFRVTEPCFLIFGVTSGDLRTLEKAFYELRVTVSVFNISRKLVGSAKLQLVVNGSRNPSMGNNVATLDQKLPRGTYQAAVTISYWTGAIAENITNSFTMHVIPKAKK